MRKNFGAQTWLYPMPVLIVGTYDENGSPARRDERRLGRDS